MSYSFQIKAASKAEAKAAVEKHFDDQVIACQPIHASDRAAVIANANAVIDLLVDDDTKDVAVSCSGDVSWEAMVPAGQRVPFTGGSISATANLAARTA